ncbi:MAG TPA: HAD family phosphatase [Phycisphaerae bacterium]
MTISGVIFDLDGVLIDSAEAHRASWRQLGREAGLAVTDAQFAATFGRQNRDIIPILLGHAVDDATLRRLSDRKEELYRELARGHLKIYPGALELIADCARAGLKLAIGSSTHPENIDLALEELGVRGQFAAIISSREVQRGKPDPQVFLLAAERLALEPSRCAVIEDAPDGIAAARAAGCATIGVTSHHPRAALAAADLIVDSLRELSAARISSLR